MRRRERRDDSSTHLTDHMFSDTFANALEYKASEGEHPVEFFEVYRDYLARFEAKIEGFIREVIYYSVF